MHLFSVFAIQLHVWEMVTKRDCFSHAQNWQAHFINQSVCLRKPSCSSWAPLFKYHSSQILASLWFNHLPSSNRAALFQNVSVEEYRSREKEIREVYPRLPCGDVRRGMLLLPASWLTSWLAGENPGPVDMAALRCQHGGLSPWHAAKTKCVDPGAVGGDVYFSVFLSSASQWRWDPKWPLPPEISATKRVIQILTWGLWVLWWSALWLIFICQGQYHEVKRGLQS